MLAAVVATGAGAFGIDTDQPPPPGVVGTPYSFVFQPKAGAPPYGFWIDAGEIPPGLKMEGDGTLHGTPTVPGTFIFTVGASQCCGPDSQWGFTLTIRDKLAITTASLPSALVGAPYSAPLSVVGNGGLGMGWKVTAGSLPPGLTVALDGTPADTTITGTPTTVGTSTFAVKVGDTDGFLPDRSTTRQLTLAVVAPFAVTAAAGKLPTGIVGKAFRGTPATAIGGLSPYTWTVSGGTLPSGLTLNPATGALVGKPTTAGSYALSIRATDADGRVGTADVAITVARALDLVTVRLPAATVGDPYRATLRAQGGQAPRTFTITGGKLPGKLKLNARSGVISGTPQTAGTFRFTVTARDALGQRSSERLSLTVHA
jgi:hypothetical protein